MTDIEVQDNRQNTKGGVSIFYHPTYFLRGDIASLDSWAGGDVILLTLTTGYQISLTKKALMRIIDWLKENKVFPEE